MQTIEPANETHKFIQLDFTGLVTDLDEEIDVELCEQNDVSTDSEAAAQAAVVKQGLALGNLDRSRLFNTDEDPSETSSTFSRKSISIFERLKQIYDEEIKKPNPLPHLSLRKTSFLLQKLVKKEKLNMVVITLFPLNKGYNICLCAEDGSVTQESSYPYVQDFILDYIENEQLPTPLLHLWEEVFPEVFYNGCVIAQIRDHRHGLPAQISFTLLKPHTQSLLNDVNLIIMRARDAGHVVTTEEMLSLESAVINTVQGPLCLDPRPSVGFKRFNLYQSKHALNTSPLRNVVKKHSQLSVSRKRKLEQSTSRSNTPLSQFIASKKPNIKSYARISSYDLINRESESRKLDPEDILNEVSRLAKPIERIKESSDWTPKLVEQYILETELLAVTYHTRLTIYQCPANSEYIGQLYVDSDYKEGQVNGSSTRFSLGTRAQANLYIKELTQQGGIFTQQGRRSVRITHVVPGQQTKVNTVGATTTPVSLSSPTPQMSKFLLMSNPNISAIANSLQKSAQQYQQQAAAAAAANKVNKANKGVNVSTVPTSSTLKNNTAILTLLNSGTAGAPPAVSQALVAKQHQHQKLVAARNMTASKSVLNSPSAGVPSAVSQALVVKQQQHQKLVAARNMTAQKNLLNSQCKPTASTGTATPTPGANTVRVPLSSLTGVAGSFTPVQSHTLNLANGTNPSALPRAVSIQTLTNNNTQAFRVKVDSGSVHTLQNIQSLASSLPSGSGIQNLGNIQALQRFSGKETGGVAASGSTASGPVTQQNIGQPSSLGLTMPGLSALLEGTPSAEDPSPGDRLNTAPQAANLNLATLQASVTSISALQNLQVQIPGLAVPISVSLNVSTPHGVTSSLPTGTMSADNVTLGNPSTSATMVITNTNPAQLLAPVVKNITAQQNCRSASPTGSVLPAGTVQLVGVPRSAAKAVLGGQRHVLKVTPTNSVRTEDLLKGERIECGQVVSLSTPQQLQFAVQKQPHVQFQPCLGTQTQAGVVTVKSRRKSGSGDPRSN